jgi:hypothetical protein
VGVGLNSPGPVTSRSGDQRQHKLFTAEPYLHGNSGVVETGCACPCGRSATPPLLFTLPVRQLSSFLPPHSLQVWLRGYSGLQQVWLVRTVHMRLPGPAPHHARTETTLASGTLPAPRCACVFLYCF